MPILEINDIQVDFPFEPYESQKRYMSKVISALRGGSNALLESPTGTGKTLCLLCAALAWRATYIAALQARAHNALSSSLSGISGVPQAEESEGVSALDAFIALVKPKDGQNNSDSNAGGSAIGGLRAPRIIYTSRTHSQLTQAVQELQRTTYRPSMVQLASRDQYCIHSISKTYSGQQLNAACRSLVNPSKRGCSFHHPVASVRPTENKLKELIATFNDTDTILDIEEFREYGAHHKACPWFLSRALAHDESNDVMFIPYNYLLDRGIRKSLDIDWNNDILIIDEAHNLENVCSSAMSFDLSPSLRGQIMKNLDACIAKGLNPMGLSIPALENLKTQEGGIDAVLGTENKDMLELRILRLVLKKLEDFIDDTQFDTADARNNNNYRVFQPKVLRDLFIQVDGPTEETYQLFLELLDRAMGKGDPKDRKNAVDVSKPAENNSPFQELQSAIRILFETIKEGDEDSFRLVIHHQGGADNDTDDANSRKKQRRTLSYWCFDSSIAMKDLQKLGLRCMLLTSGTLSPLSTFAGELNVSFPIRLENPHVITKQQVMSTIVCESPGPNAVRLSSAYRKRGTEVNMALGRTILHVCSVIPDGILVFFPSYSTMKSCIESFKKTGTNTPSLWEQLVRRKALVQEERNNDAAMEKHRANVDARIGSILFAVCRGKISEGIDFSDEYGRCVIITGLPYPSLYEPKVRLKRELCDKKQRRLGTGIGTSGNDWYGIQAIRAVNQAIGRAVRHRYDYGAVLLCDERFRDEKVRNILSSWIKPCISVAETFHGMSDEIERFFVGARNAVGEGKTKKDLIENNNNNNDRKRRNDDKGDGRFFLASNAPDTGHTQAVLSGEDDLLEKVGELSQLSLESVRRKRPRSQLIDDEEGKTLTIAEQFLASRKNEQARPPVRSMSRPPRVAANNNDEDNLNGNSNRNRNMDGGGTSKEGGIAADKRPAAVRVKKKRKQGADARDELSRRARALFGKNKADFKEFIRLFREIVAAGKRAAENAGPISSAQETRAAERRGVELATEIVAFTRGKTGDGDGNGNGDRKRAEDDLLRQVRTHVPVRFRAAFDMALRDKR